jgi:hypothetical protein
LASLEPGDAAPNIPLAALANQGCGTRRPQGSAPEGEGRLKRTFEE